MSIVRGSLPILLFATPMFAAEPASIEPERCLRVLEAVMRTETGWVQVHAADSLLNHGYKKLVAGAFEGEKDTTTPLRRIGVWRVLARASESEIDGRLYVERIRAAMLDPNGPDRVNAAESLGKLDRADKRDLPALEGWLKTIEEAAAPMPLWLVIMAGDTAERPAAEARMARYLVAKDPLTRLRAAFAFSKLATITDASSAALERQWQVEPVDSTAKPYLAVALLVHAKSDPDIQRWKKASAFFLASDKANEQLEAATAIGLKGSPDDLKLLMPLLTGPNGDTRIGAADGCLRILLRHQLGVKPPSEG